MGGALLRVLFWAYGGLCRKQGSSRVKQAAYRGQVGVITVVYPI